MKKPIFDQFPENPQKWPKMAILGPPGGGPGRGTKGILNWFKTTTFFGPPQNGIFNQRGLRPIVYRPPSNQCFLSEIRGVFPGFAKKVSQNFGPRGPAGGQNRAPGGVPPQNGQKWPKMAFFAIFRDFCYFSLFLRFFYVFYRKNSACLTFSSNIITQRIP